MLFRVLSFACNCVEVEWVVFLRSTSFVRVFLIIAFGGGGMVVLSALLGLYG